MGYSVIYNSLAIKTKHDKYVLFLQLGESNTTSFNAKGREVNSKYWFVASVLYRLNSKDILLQNKEAILANVKAKLLNISNGNLEKESYYAFRSLKNYGVTYSTLFNHFKYSINHAVEIEDVGSIKILYRLSIDDSKSLKNVIIRTDDEFESFFSNPNISASDLYVFFQKNNIVKRKEKVETDNLFGKYYITNDKGYLLMKHRNGYVYWQLHDDFYRETFAVIDAEQVIKYAKPKHCKLMIYDTVEDCLKALVDNDLTCNKPNKIFIQIIGSKMRNTSEKDVAILLSNFNYIREYYMIYLPDVNSWFYSLTAKTLRHNICVGKKILNKASALKTFDTLVGREFTGVNKFILVHYKGNENEIIKTSGLENVDINQYKSKF